MEKSDARDSDLIQAMAAELLRLREVVSLFAAHAPDCACLDGYPCTCGLDRLTS